MSMTRKEFLGTIAGAVGLATVVGACGSSSSSGADAPATSGNCLQNGTSVTIGANHGHVLMVTQAEVQAGVDKTYDIMGTALHTHSVTVTAAMFAKLAMNMSVMTVSTVGASHTHDITVVWA